MGVHPGAVLGAFARTLRRETHVLSLHPTLLWQQLYNRLQWEGEEVVEFLEGELERRSRPGAPPWIRARTPFGESASLTRVMAGHEGVVWDCQVDSRGSFIVSAGFDGTLKVWDVGTGLDRATLRGHSAEVLCCRISPDSSFLVSASADRTLRIWDLAAMAERSVLVGHTDEVTQCLIHPSGDSIVSASKDGTVRIWDVVTGVERLRLRGHAGPVHSCAPSEDGRLVLSAGGDGLVKVWDVRSGRELHSFEGHTQGVHSCALHPDGRYAASSSKDRTVRVWDLETGRERETLAGFAGDVTGCLFSPDGSYLVSFGLDLKVWNVGSWEEHATLEGHVGGIQACAVSPDGARIVSGGWDHDLRLWDPRTGSEVKKLPGHTNAVTSCAFLPDGASLVTASVDRTVRLWDLSEEERGETPPPGEPRGPIGHSSTVSCVAYSPDGSFVASGSGGSPDRVAIWEEGDLQRRASMTGHNWPARAIGVSPDCSFIVSVGGDMLVWESRTGRKHPRIPHGPGTSGHVGGVWSFAISPDSRLIVSGGYDRLLKVWDSRTGALRSTLTGHEGQVNACAVSPDGRFIVSASIDQTLRIWDAETGGAVATLQTEASVSDCAVSPDGAHLVSAEGGDRLKVWDPVTGSPRGVLSHPAEITGFCISPDSTFLVSADKDGGVRSWDLDSATERVGLEGHGAEVRASAVTPDARLVVTAGSDHTLQVWDAGTGRRRAAIVLPGELTSLALHPSAPRLLCGDHNGHLHALELVGIEYGSPVVTAVGEGEGFRVRCPACFSSFALERNQVGRDVRCPSPDCREALRISASVGAGALPWRPVVGARAQGAKGEPGSLEGILERAGLPNERVDWREWAVFVRGRGGERRPVRVTEEGKWVRFGVPLPAAERPVSEPVLRNLLRATHATPFTRVLLVGFGNPVLSADARLASLSPALAGGLLEGIASFAGMRTLSDWHDWQVRIASCRSSLAEHHGLDSERMLGELARLAASAAIPLRRLETRILLSAIDLEQGKVPVRILVERGVLTVQLPLPWLDRDLDRELMLSILKRNLTSRTAKIGLDARDRTVLSYQAPRVDQELLGDVQRQFSTILDF